MLSVLDADNERTGDALQVPGPRARDNLDVHAGGTTLHGAAVLQGEAAALAVESAGYNFDSDIPGVAGRQVTSAHHLAAGSAFNISVELFLERVSANTFDRSRRQRGYFNAEGSVGVMHGVLLRVCWGGCKIAIIMASSRCRIRYCPTAARSVATCEALRPPSYRATPR